MNVFEEMQLAQKREKEREDRFAALVSSFDLLSREDQLAILARLANRLESSTKNGVAQTPSAPATTEKPSQAASQTDEANLQARAYALLQSHPEGLSVARVARELYGVGPGGLPLRSDGGRARSMLNYLKDYKKARSETRENGENVWFAVSPGEDPADLAEEPGTTELIRRAVGESLTPMTMAQIVSAVHRVKPNSKKHFVYSAVFKMWKTGRFVKHENGTYSLNKGYDPRRAQAAK